jgi:hypothetical protein
MQFNTRHEKCKNRESERKVALMTRNFMAKNEMNFILRKCDVM